MSSLTNISSKTDTKYHPSRTMKLYAIMDSSNFTHKMPESTGMYKMSSIIKHLIGNFISLLRMNICHKRGIWLLHCFSQWNAGQEWKPTTSKNVYSLKMEEKLQFIFWNTKMNIDKAVSQMILNFQEQISILRSSGMSLSKMCKRFCRVTELSLMAWQMGISRLEST